MRPPVRPHLHVRARASPLTFTSRRTSASQSAQVDHTSRTMTSRGRTMITETNAFANKRAHKKLNGVFSMSLALRFETSRRACQASPLGAQVPGVALCVRFGLHYHGPLLCSHDGSLLCAVLFVVVSRAAAWVNAAARPSACAQGAIAAAAVSLLAFMAASAAAATCWRRASPRYRALDAPKAALFRNTCAPLDLIIFGLIAARPR